MGTLTRLFHIEKSAHTRLTLGKITLNVASVIDNTLARSGSFSHSLIHYMCIMTLLAWSYLFVQLFLSLTLSLKKLAKAASTKAQESKETILTDRHIKLVFAVSLWSISYRQLILQYTYYTYYGYS